MRIPRCFPIAAVVVQIMTISTSSYAATSSCDTIITHGLRNIEVSKSTEAAIAARYFNHCQKNFESLSDEQLGSVEVEVFGQGAGDGSYNRKRREERLQTWCTTNRDLAISNRTAYTESQVFYQGAVSAWEKCNALYSAHVRITPEITPDGRTVDIGIVYTGPTRSGILFYGIKTEGFTCEVTGPEGKDLTVPFEFQSLSTEEKKKDQTREINNLNVHISCIRDTPTEKVRNDQNFKVLSRGTIAIQTSSDPFQLYFAEEWDPELPAKEADQIRKLMRQAELPIGTIVMSSLTPDQFMNSKNPQYTPEKWTVADGRALPVGTLYEQITGNKVTPDMRTERAALNVLDIVSVSKNHGENVVSAKTEAGKQGEWKWFTSGRDVHGNRANNDYEQDADQFQTYIDDNGVVIAQGRTLNFKHGVYGAWRPGSGNLLGVSTAKKSYYYYVKIN